MADKPLISVIILNWNGEKLLGRCLAALDGQTFKDFETIIVDNASTDRSIEIIEQSWPQAKLIKSDRNLGFAAANNLGARMARGKWIAFLNNDAFPLPEWLDSLFRAAQTNPEVTAFASLILKAHAPDILESAGDEYHVSGLAWHHLKDHSLDAVSLEQAEIFSACAAAAMIEKAAFDLAGGFDEQFISHFEDVDLGFRLWLSGKKCLFVPEARVLHLGSASYGVENDVTIYRVQRNVVWTFFKNMPGPLFWKYLPAHLFANMVFLIYYISKGKWKPVMRAKLDSIRALNRVLQERRQIQAEIRADIRVIDHLMNHNWIAPYLLGKRGARILKMPVRSGSS